MTGGVEMLSIYKCEAQGHSQRVELLMNVTSTSEYMFSEYMFSVVHVLFTLTAVQYLDIAVIAVSA